MKYMVIASTGIESTIDAPSVEAVIEQILRDSFKYSNWSLLREDITQIYRPVKDFHVLAATVDVGLRKVLMTYPVGYWPCEQESEGVSA